MFVLQNNTINNNWGLENQGLQIAPFEFENRIAKFDLTLTAMESEAGIEFELEYCTRLYEKETIQRMTRHFLRVLEQIIANPDQKLAEIELITEEEKRQILYEFNDTRQSIRKTRPSMNCLRNK